MTCNSVVEKISDHKDLIVWQKSVRLVIEIYKRTNLFPKSELYCLVNQMRRCSISIPSNIAEGYRRRSTGDYVRFLAIADASAAELETQIIIAKELYPNIIYNEAENLLLEVQKMLYVMIRRVKK